MSGGMTCYERDEVECHDPVCLNAGCCLVTPKGWQPIETAPHDGTRVLLFQPGRGAFEGWWHDDWPHAEHYWRDDADSEPNPSHWQALLPAPAAAKTEVAL